MNKVVKNRRAITAENILIFKQKLLEIDWLVLYELSGANDSYDYFINVFFHLYNICFPVVESCVKKKWKKPWITHSLLKSIKKKYRLYKLFIKHSSSANRKNYVDYKNVLTNAVRLSKQKYFNNLFLNVKGNVKKPWFHINNLMGRCKNHTLPSKMYTVRHKDGIKYF